MRSGKCTVENCINGSVEHVVFRDDRGNSTSKSSIQKPFHPVPRCFHTHTHTRVVYLFIPLSTSAFFIPRWFSRRISEPSTSFMTSSWNSKIHHHPPDRPSLMVSGMGMAACGPCKHNPLLNRTAWYLDSCNSTVLRMTQTWMVKHFNYPTNQKQSTWLILTRLVNCNFSTFLPKWMFSFSTSGAFIVQLSPRNSTCRPALKSTSCSIKLRAFHISTVDMSLTSPCQHIKGHGKHPNKDLPFTVCFSWRFPDLGKSLTSFLVSPVATLNPPPLKASKSLHWPHFGNQLL